MTLTQIIRCLFLSALLVATLGVGSLTYQSLPPVPNGTCPGAGSDICPG